MKYLFGTNIAIVLDLGKEVKKNCVQNDMLAWQYNTIGVSDGITMGGEGTMITCYNLS
jgi:dihydroxyacid dehydratase/phosphogluconate dehydratase